MTVGASTHHVANIGGYCLVYLYNEAHAMHARGRPSTRRVPITALLEAWFVPCYLSPFSALLFLYGVIYSAPFPSLGSIFFFHLFDVLRPFSARPGPTPLSEPLLSTPKIQGSSDICEYRGETEEAELVSGGTPACLPACLRIAHRTPHHQPPCRNRGAADGCVNTFWIPKQISCARK